MSSDQDQSDLELMFQSSPIGMCHLDCDLRYVRINATLAAMNGLTVSEHIGRTLCEVLPDIAPTLEPTLRQVLSTGKAILNAEVHGRAPSEPEFERGWICNYYPLLTEEGTLRGVASTVQEITEHTRADASRQRLLDSISEAHAGFILGDDPRILFDGLLSALLSLTDSEYGFIGEVLRTPNGDPYLKTHAITNIAWNEETRAFYDANAPTGLEFFNLKTLFGAVMTSGTTLIANKPAADPRRGGTPPGHPALNAFLGLPLHLGDQLIGTVGLANRPGGYDEETVQYLQPLLGTCGHLIAADRSERSRKKAEAELYQAQRLESLGMLAGGMAHDLNNMLTPILGYAGLLIQDTPSDDHRREDLEEIQKAAEQAKELTQQLLAFSHKQVLELKTVRFGEVVVDYENTLRRLVRENIELVISVNAETAHIDADPSKLRQVLLNLAVNAQDAMPNGGTLSMEVSEVFFGEERRSETRAGPYVLLSVTDTGHGMDEDTVSKVFDPFYSTKGRGKGTGLGLATVHGIVQQHNGWIDVQSTRDEGTMFKLYFPRAERPSRHPPAAQQRQTVSEGTETVLVVEDEDIVRRLACRLLRAKGYTVIDARHGEDALRQVQKHGDRIDLLLTDVVMPKMGGRELYRKLKTTQPNLRVLFVSGYTDGLVNQDDLSESGAAFLAKPFSATSLPRKVREVLDDQAGRMTAQPSYPRSRPS